MSLSSTISDSSNIGDGYQQQQQNQQFSSFDQQQNLHNISSSSSSSVSTSSTSLNNINNINNDNILTQMLHQIQQLQSTVTNQQHQIQALHNPSSSSSLVKPSKPSVFTGSKIGSAAYLWLEDLKNYFLAAGINGNYRTVFAVAHLKEEALLWKTSITELSNPQSVDFDTFGELFLRRFQPISSNLEAREQLRRLKYNGNIQQYVSSFQSIMQKITDMTNTDKLDYFSNGLNRSLKLELIKQNVTDLQQAIHIAVRISSIDNHITSSTYNNNNNNTIYNNNNNTPSSSTTSTTSSDNMQIEHVLNNIENNDDNDNNNNNNNNEIGQHMNDGHQLNVIGNRNRFSNYNNGRNGTGFKNNNNGSNNGFGNRNNNNNNNNYNNNSNIKCYYCGKIGHVQNKCRKLAFDNTGRNGFRNNNYNNNSNNNRFNNYNSSNIGNSSKNEYGQRQQ